MLVLVAAGWATAGAACPLAAAPETAAPSRAFIRLETSCFPPNEISPSPTTRAGEYAPRLMLSGRALRPPNKAKAKKDWYCMADFVFLDGLLKRICML